VECYKQASWLHQHTDWLKASGDATGANLATKIDGYSWVVKAITLRGSDPQMEFAAALMTTDGARSETRPPFAERNGRSESGCNAGAKPVQPVSQERSVGTI